MPVSGGGFVVQLAALQLLSGIGFVPDVTLGSSGGNVAAYVGAAANWRWASIERIARELSNHLFVQSWNSFRIISYLMGYYKGELYNSGDGVEEFLKRHFAEDTIKHYELWTGTYNQQRQRACLFSNRSKGKTLLNPDIIDIEMAQCLPPVYTNGDFTIIAKASLASASIPALVPAQEIFGENYVDGGVSSASPLTVMKEPIIHYMKQTGEPLHIVYINSDNLSTPGDIAINTALDRTKQAIDALIRSHGVIDRQIGYDIIRCHDPNSEIHKDEFPCTPENLQRLGAIWDNLHCSMLEVYPEQGIEVDITNFNGDDVLDKLAEVRDVCHCRLWWVTSPEPARTASIRELIETCKSVSVNT